MRLKISAKTKNRLSDNIISSAIHDEMMEIARLSIPSMEHKLNSTEAPDPDPRRAHINVKKWSVSIKSKKRAVGVGYHVLLRAINSQAPTYYIAYRTLKNRNGLTDTRNFKRPRTKWYDPIAEKPLTKEERDAVEKYARETYEYTRKIGYTPRQSSIVRKSILNRYKKLVPVKVRVDNIAFSRLFASKNIIRPNPSKYTPYDFAQCLKIWDSDMNKFRYAAHAYPKSNGDSYYYSRVNTMIRAIEETVDK